MKMMKRKYYKKKKGEITNPKMAKEKTKVKNMLIIITKHKIQI